MAIRKDAYGNERFRVGGQGFTAFQWEGHIIGFARRVRHTAPRPVANPVAIQPLDQRYPLQILTAAALTAGTLEVEMFERYNKKIWDDIMNVTATQNKIAVPNGGFNDLVQISIALTAINKPINCVKIINPPVLSGQADAKKPLYGDVYHRCMITDIRDDEDIEIGSMEVVKSMTIMYTRYTRFPGKFSSGVNIDRASPFLSRTGTFDV